MVILPEDIKNRILSVVGYPLVTFDELKELGSEEEFKDIIIKSALFQFFTWFPIINRQEYQVSSTFEIDFPTINTFTAVDVRLNTAGFVVRDTNNPFVNNSIYQSLPSGSGSSFGGGAYGTVNDYGFREARVYERLERQTMINMNKAVRHELDFVNNKLTGYTNITGRLVVSWGEYSEDFNKVQFRWRDDVIKLCQAKLLEHLGMIRGQSSNNLPNAFNYDLFLRRAKDLNDEVLNKFKKFSKPVIIRG